VPFACLHLYLMALTLHLAGRRSGTETIRKKMIRKRDNLEQRQSGIKTIWNGDDSEKRQSGGADNPEPRRSGKETIQKRDDPEQRQSGKEMIRRGRQSEAGDDPEQETTWKSRRSENRYQLPVRLQPRKLQFSVSKFIFERSSEHQ